jgi:Mg2+ and Co2+ transporter CorA
MENLRKNQTEIFKNQTKSTVEGHSNGLEQVEDRISEFKEKIEIQDKTEELLVKQFKSCEKNIQELRDSIKNSNLRVMGIVEREELQAKGVHNIFNKIVSENFPNLEKLFPIQI